MLPRHWWRALLARFRQRHSPRYETLGATQMIPNAALVPNIPDDVGGPLHQWHLFVLGIAGLEPGLPFNFGHKAAVSLFLRCAIRIFGGVSNGATLETCLMMRVSRIFETSNSLNI
jgi:hypothetical protein